MADFSLVGAGIETLNYGADLTTSRGTAVTASATPNTEGSYAQLTASTSDDINGFILDIGVDDGLPQPSDILISIAIGAAASEVVVYDKLIISPSANLDSDYHKSVFVPIVIPAGQRISAKCQGSSGSEVVLLSITAYPNVFTAGQLGSEVISIGANTADSGGVTVDPGATVNTKGSFVEMTASLSMDICGIWATQGTITNTANRVSRAFYDIAVGAAASEVVVAPNLTYVVSQQESSFTGGHFIPVSIAAGTRISIRSQSSTNDATDRLVDHVLYGLV